MASADNHTTKRINIDIENWFTREDFISLLERFNDSEKGQILFNGKGISNVNIYTYHKHLSLVSQEPTLFQGQHFFCSRDNFCTDYRRHDPR